MDDSKDTNEPQDRLPYRLPTSYKRSRAEDDNDGADQEEEEEEEEEQEPKPVPPPIPPTSIPSPSFRQQLLEHSKKTSELLELLLFTNFRSERDRSSRRLQANLHKTQEDQKAFSKDMLFRDRITDRIAEERHEISVLTDLISNQVLDARRRHEEVRTLLARISAESKKAREEGRKQTRVLRAIGRCMEMRWRRSPR